MNFFTAYPEPDELLTTYALHFGDDIPSVNGHIHSPFSFSAFDNLEQAFRMALSENVDVLGLNDFYVADGYPDFARLAKKYHIFPLFNLECIGLLKSEQKKGIRINDPSNPGRIYFSGKGLDFPFKLDAAYTEKLGAVIGESQKQMRDMVDKANAWFASLGVNITLDYDQIKTEYAKELVRERHLAKAIRIAVFEQALEVNERKALLAKIYGGKESKVDVANIPAIDNEIRGNLLKLGGPAFVEEDEKAFLSLDEVIALIRRAGGIPCYPVLLDDKAGNYTEFEADAEKLFEELTRRNIWSLELIPGRNDFDHLKRFVQFFHKKGFVITFGTEHNAPEMIPITVDTRGGKALDEELRLINYDGACIVAAHQYLRSKGKEGYINPDGTPKTSEKSAFIMLGRAVIEHFRNQ